MKKIKKQKDVKSLFIDALGQECKGCLYFGSKESYEKFIRKTFLEVKKHPVQAFYFQGIKIRWANIHIDDLIANHLRLREMYNELQH